MALGVGWVGYPHHGLLIRLGGSLLDSNTLSKTRYSPFLAMLAQASDNTCCWALLFFSRFIIDMTFTA